MKGYARLILLFATALIIRIAFLLDSGFDGLYGQDAYAYLNWSENFRNEILSFNIPKKFFYWPVGYFLITSFVSLIIPLPMKTVALGVSIISGSLLAPAVYRLAKEISAVALGKESAEVIALYSGLIVCFSGTLIKSSVVIMSDALAVLLITCGIYYLIKYSGDYSLPELVKAFIFLALAVMTRYAYALCIVLFLTVITTAYFRSGRSFEVIKAALISLTAGLIVSIPELYYMINYGISYFQYEGDNPTWASSWSILNFFRSSFVTFDGVKDYRFINSVYYLAPIFHPLYLSVFGFTFLAGCMRLIKLRYLMLIFTAWFLPFYFFLSGVPYQSLRYAIGYLPLFIIISATGLSSARLSSFKKNVFFVTGIVVLLAAAYIHFIKFNQQKQTELEVAEYVRTNFNDRDMILSYDVTFAIEHYSAYDVTEFATCPLNDIKNITEANGTVYLILPIEKIRTQYKGFDMERKLDYLLANYKSEYKAVIYGYDVIKIDVR